MINVEDNFILDRTKEGLTEKEIELLDSMSIEEIENIIGYCDNQFNYYNTKQNGEKLLLNSIYGAFGNQYFVCSTKDIANAITVMARNTIKLVDEINEEYWYKFWPHDTKIHNMLGITDVKPINDDYFHLKTAMDWSGEVKKVDIEDGIYQRTNPVSPYIDTDSLFVCFDHALENCDYSGDPKVFVKTIAESRLEPLYDKYLKQFASKYNVDNIQNFELENINESILFITKKKYIKHILWEDRRDYDRLTNIAPKGVTLVQSATPKFARDKLYYIIRNVFFDKPKEISIKKVAKLVKEYKKEFIISDINDIAQGGKVNDYWSPGKITVEVKKGGKVMGTKRIDAPGVVDDKDTLTVAKGTYFTRKAAALYNHMLHKEDKLMNIYKFIEDGDAIKYYPVAPQYHDMYNYLETNKTPSSSPRFAYRLGEYPKEFALPVEYDELFYTTFLKPLNGYLMVLGLPEINKKMRITFSLFA